MLNADICAVTVPLFRFISTFRRKDEVRKECVAKARFFKHGWGQLWLQ